MTASRWTKRHGSLLMSRGVVYMVSTTPSIAFMLAFEQWRTTLGLVLTMALCVGSFLLAKYYLDRKSAYVMSRAFSAEYELTEFALRKLFSDASIRFQRQLEEESKTHRYEFLGYGLSLTLRLYDLVNGIELGHDDASQSVLVDRMGVIISLHNVSASNQAFANKLTNAIDDAIG